jgi:hypothetical protein
MRKLFTVLAGAMLSAAGQTQAQSADTTAVVRHLFIICDVQHATVGAVVKIPRVIGSGYMSVSFGITYLMAVDTAGKRVTLVYGHPIPVWKGSAQFLNYRPASGSQYDLATILSDELGKDGKTLFPIVVGQKVFADGQLTDYVLDLRPMRSTVIDRMKKSCED